LLIVVVARVQSAQLFYLTELPMERPVGETPHGGATGIMKIAQISPLAESCPPKLYGGTERIVSYLTEELVRLGHEVTLFASGDSITAATLAPCSKTGLRLNPSVKDMTPYHVMMLDEVYRRVDEFDVLHFHIDYLHYPLMRRFSDRVVTTLHGRLDVPDVAPFYSAFPGLPLVSISNAQRRPMPPVNWVSTIMACRISCCRSPLGQHATTLPFSDASRPKRDQIGRSRSQREQGLS